MNTRLVVGGCVLLLTVVVCCGCTEQTGVQENIKDQTTTSNLLPVIQECRAEYFDTSDTATVFFIGVATDSDGTIVRYFWNLSDGFTTSQQSFVHTFSHPGAYQARLMVMDDKGGTNTTSITIYVYDTSFENSQNDQTRIIGRWENTQGTIIEFTSDGRYLNPAQQVENHYWFSAGGLYIRSSADNQTVRYEYSFKGDNTVLFYPAGHPPAAQDTWVRIH